jgi:hypothetical protein
MEERLQQALYLVEQAEKENEELRVATKGNTQTNELLSHEVQELKDSMSREKESHIAELREANRQQVSRCLLTLVGLF